MNQSMCSKKKVDDFQDEIHKTQVNVSRLEVSHTEALKELFIWNWKLKIFRFTPDSFGIIATNNEELSLEILNL
ncbi:hypothetical protein C1645_831657 [Glomus cerebriforme]|uniref:Uncharacterized protein n=1 Tax=Glomus cerebriforme TaxID=658196 RepID=A0A397SLJ9_9GLOM|nr:hypothetical protein C1645_831657 [Glomus cerebriforme]